MLVVKAWLSSVSPSWISSSIKQFFFQLVFLPQSILCVKQKSRCKHYKLGQFICPTIISVQIFFFYLHNCSRCCLFVLEGYASLCVESQTSICSPALAIIPDNRHLVNVNVKTWVLGIPIKYGSFLLDNDS